MGLLSELTGESSRKRKQLWEEKGYLVLPAFFKAEEIDPVNMIVERLAGNPNSAGKATVDALSGHIKVNDSARRKLPARCFWGLSRSTICSWMSRRSGSLH